MPRALERRFQAHVRHGGGDHQIAGEQSARLQVARGHQQDRVAVDHVVLGAGQHAAVGVAVEGEAQLRSARFHFRRHIVRMQRAAVQLMLRPSGSMLSSATSPPSCRKELRRNRRRRAICAIGHDAQPGQRQSRHAVDEELDVVGLERWVVLDRRAALPGRDARDLRARDAESRPPWPAPPHRPA